MIKNALIIYLEKTEDSSFTRKLLLGMYDIGIVLYLLSWSTLPTRGFAEQNILYETVVATI